MSDAKRPTPSDLEVLTQVARLVHSSHELQQVLDNSLEAALYAVRAQRGFLVLARPDGTQEVAAVANVSAEQVHGEEMAYSRTALREVERTRAPFVTNDAGVEPRLASAESVRRRRLRAIACVPMLRGDTLVGFLYVDTTNRLRAFSERDVQLLAVVGEMAATAVERAMLIRQLCRQERLAALGTAAAGIAHELNNPLTNILAYAQVMRADERVGALEELAVIESEGRRCAAIVRSLLALGRPQAIAPREVSLAEVVRQALRLRRPHLHEAGIAVEEDLGEELPPVRGEPDLLLQVLLNLLVNAEHAIQACPTRRLRVRLQRVDANALDLRVEDSGPGVPEDARPRIFDPFFTTKAPGEGTGLGLSICAGIVRDHRGSITVGASQLGGAAFTVTLPLP